MKLQRDISHITVFIKSLFVNKQIIGILGLIIAYAIFLIEIIEFVGFNALRVIFSIVAFANFSLLLFSIFQNYWIRICGSAIYLLLLWSNVLNFRFFGSTMHIGTLLNISFLPVLGPQILFLIRWFDVFYLLSFISGIIFFKYSPKTSIQKRIPKIIFFAGVWLFLQIFLYFAATQSSINSAKKYNEQFTRWAIYKDIRLVSRDHTGSVLYFGFLWTYGVDLYRMNKKPTYVEPIPESNFSVHIPAEKQRNIIALQVESLDKHVIYHKVDDKPVMPFLHRLTQQSIYFSKVYAQHTSVGGTSDAEFCVLTSQYPLGHKGTFFALGLEALPSIPVILNRNGFVTLAFHGNSGSYFNRKQGLIGLGFQRSFFKDDFTITDPDKWHALKDKNFLHQVQQILAGSDTPYFAFILTLTSHTPFDLIDERDYVSNFSAEDPVVRNYLNSMAYVDSALKEFITAMQRVDPKVLIILFGDHCANIHETEYKSYNIKGLEPIPLFILDQSNQTNKELLIAGSTIDIGPTLFDYLGVEIPTFWQGKSLLDEQNNKNTFILNSPNYFDANGTLQKLSEGSVDSEELYRIQKYIW
ncbi:MAG: LTA synthase family protein [Candidatus Marinimicrobia bacterium]|jgi:phosphoglycerol transferase MdoB-like AlkP superfamily enzyme|nr:LTA synthase family protein [Candidatus Neomarinimicrobiota bacterium]|tara:strand:- start:460 stop:2208 length:1749 start_codon:yes stop_codon:yes gene_type:complete